MPKITVYALGLSTVVVSALMYSRLRPGREHDVKIAAEIPRSAAMNDMSVELTPDQLASADIAVGEVRKIDSRASRTIAGRLDYDHERHVLVKAACDGIVTETRVRPGDNVTKGQVVAVINCPEVRVARSEVRNRLADLDLAQSKFEWQHSICDGVPQLVAMIRQRSAPDDIERALQGESLGKYNEQLMASYTRYLLALRNAENSRDAAARGAIAAKIQRQRESELNTSEAALKATIEQSIFDVRQQCDMARAEAAETQRMVDISLQNLKTLLGPAASEVTVEQFREPTVDALADVDLVSPIDGTLEERMFTKNERVVADETVFTIADCQHLWAAADVRERDWDVMSVATGQQVDILAPAIPDVIFQGKILMIGRRVDPTTRTAQLIAALERTDTRLRPGLFIRMRISTGTRREVTAVPESAVVVHENMPFVFVAETERRFRRVDVSTGGTEDGYTEIVSGLDSGDRIVTQGTFTLKSQLLLAGEAD